MATRSNAIKELRRQGQSLWLDNIRRQLITSGELARLRDEGLTGVTSNPTIFEKAVSGSTDYDEAMVHLVRAGKKPEEMLWQLMVEDVQAAADVFRPVYDKTKGKDGFVSIEVGPTIATNTKQTIKFAEYLHDQCRRPNVMVKIPATQDGLRAVPAAVQRTALGKAAQGRRAHAALPVGEHLDQGSALPRHLLRRGAHRSGHRRHHSAGDAGRVPGARRGPAQPGRERGARQAAAQAARGRGCRSRPGHARAGGGGRRVVHQVVRDAGRHAAQGEPEDQGGQGAAAVVQPRPAPAEGRRARGAAAEGGRPPAAVGQRLHALDVKPGQA